MRPRARRALAIAVLLAAAPTASAEWKPAGDRIKTRWAATVTPENVWREYPRPQMVRKDRQNLNGLWDYTVRPRPRGGSSDAPTEWAGKILVPFCIESSLSGVGRLLQGHEELWYRRDVNVARGSTPSWARTAREDPHSHKVPPGSFASLRGTSPGIRFRMMGGPQQAPWEVPDLCFSRHSCSCAVQQPLPRAASAVPDRNRSILSSPETRQQSTPTARR